MPNTKAVLGSLKGLMAGRAVEEVERFAVTEIKKHRHLRDEASFLDGKFMNLRTERKSGGPKMIG